jgi:uncharacterized damage-inducible protein DinB
MSTRELLSDQLTRAYWGGSWHGPALKEVLANVTPEMAHAKPLNGAHSIWELLLHIGAWETVCSARLRGIRTDAPDTGDFPAVPNAQSEDWAETLEVMDGGHKELLSQISALSDSKLGQTVIGTDYSIEFMLHGVLQHLVYHTGQIALLSKAFEIR